ncbi:acyltransferase family protein [Gordonia alkaliphila]|uniref:Acyltransferase n=1 Tax=Gordonia alkaliphila TaxID=1053547 RepID=A0ABP8YYA0_9ACTN
MQAQIFAVLIGGITLLGLFLRVLVRRGRLRSDAVGRILVGLLIAGTVASFGWATLVGPANQTLNYYSTFARFWEIALGGLVALVITRVHLPTWARQLAGVAGLTMLAITGLVLDGAATFPGPAALLPLGGTALTFVAGTTGGSTVTRALASRPIVYLGSIAYPLYLWHWPLLVLFLVYRNFRGAAVTQVSLVDGLAIIAVSLVLAAATDFLLKADSPVRRLRIRVPVILAATAAALTVAITAWLAPIPQVSADDLDPALYPGAAAAAGAPVPRGVEFAPRAEAARMDLPQSGFDDCVAYYDREGPVDVVSCDYGAPRAPGRKVLAMVGGSHVDHFLPAVDLIGKEQGFTVELVVMVGCSLGYGPTAATSHDSERCVQWQAKAMDHIVDTRPDAVFTNSTRPAKPFGTGDHVPQWYVDAFTRLSDAGIPVVGIRDLPWLMTADDQTIEPFDCMAVRDDAVACGVSRDWSLAPVDPAIEALGSLPGVSLIDASDQYCGPEECPVVVGNVLVYRDAHHFTKTFVLSMRPFLERELSRTLGWFEAPGAH